MAKHAQTEQPTLPQNEPPPDPKPTNGPATALVPLGQVYPILSLPPEDVHELVTANLGPGRLGAFDLERIRVPSGGGLSWIVNDPEKGETEVKEIEGIVLHWKEPRAYWKQSLQDSGGGTPPDCASADGVIGVGDPGGECQKCPMAAWGSSGKGTRGQACKQMRFLFVLQPKQVLPACLICPPTSIQPVRKLFLSLTAQALPFYGAVLAFALERDKNEGGIAYSKVRPRLVRKLAAEEVAQVRKLSSSIKAGLDATRVEDDDKPTPA